MRDRDSAQTGLASSANNSGGVWAVGKNSAPAEPSYYGSKRSCLKRLAWAARRSRIGGALAPLTAQGIYRLFELNPTLIFQAQILRRWAARLQRWAALDPRPGPVQVAFGALRGRWIVNDPSPASPTFLVLGIEEVMNQVLLERLVKPGDVVYDVGANIGTHTLLLAGLCAPAGRVYAFEPWPPNLESLQTNLRLNNVRNVQIVSCALSDRSGEGWFQQGEDHSTGKLVRDSAQQGASVRVPVVSLDDFARSAEPPKVLKIDVEGAEGEVLRGARRVLLEDRPSLICEVHNDSAGEDVRAVLQQTNYGFLVLENRAKSLEVDGRIPCWCHILGYPREGKKRALASLQIKEA